MARRCNAARPTPACTAATARRSRFAPTRAPSGPAPGGLAPHSLPRPTRPAHSAAGPCNSTTTSTETYDADGALQTIRQRNGWTTTLTYSTAATPVADYLSGAATAQPGRLISVKNQFGRELRLVYDATGRLAQLLPPGAVKDGAPNTEQSPIRYGYDAVGNLASVTWQDGSTKRYHHEDARWPNAVTGLTDEAGTRVANYAYDAQGRATQSERGGDRYLFSYGGYPGTTGSQTYVTAPDGATRTYTYEVAGGVIRPTTVSAPCPAVRQHLPSHHLQRCRPADQADRPRRQRHLHCLRRQGPRNRARQLPRQLQHRHHAPGAGQRQQGRQHQVARHVQPAHASSPSRTRPRPTPTTAKACSRAQSWTATTDATGAAKFSALKTGSTYATGWSYSASSLATTIVTKETAAGATVAVETGRWTATYAANGDLTRATDVTRGNRFGRVTQRDAHGRIKDGVTDDGVAVGLDYSPRGFVVKETTNAQAVMFMQNALGQTTQVRTPDAQTLSFEYDAALRLVNVKLNGASITPQMIAKSDYPDTLLRAATARASALAIEGLMRLLPTAHAQTLPNRLPPVIVPGRESPGQPSLDPEIDRLLSRPFTDYDSNARRIGETFARMCECKPDGGYSKPTFTSVTYAHLLFGGHLSERFSSKGYFSSTEAVGQTLVDEVVRVGRRVSQRGSRDVWEATLPRSFTTSAGYARQSDGTFKPTDNVRMSKQRRRANELRIQRHPPSHAHHRERNAALSSASSDKRAP